MQVFESDLKTCMENTLALYVGAATNYKHVRKVLLEKAPMTVFTLQLLVERDCGRRIDFEWLRRLCTLVAYREAIDVPVDFILMDSQFANLVYWSAHESVLVQSF